MARGRCVGWRPAPVLTRFAARSLLLAPLFLALSLLRPLAARGGDSEGLAAATVR